MTTHIAAKDGQIAETVLLPGDPLRAKFIADNFLDEPTLYNDIRGMYGYTGSYKGQRVSIQATGMGIPSISIYVNELITGYHVKNLIRIGTAGAISKKLSLNNLVLVQSAATNSGLEREYLNNEVSFIPPANFELLTKAFEILKKQNKKAIVTSAFSTDFFYEEKPEICDRLAQFGVGVVEMETAALYMIAAKYNVKALSMVTISDHLVTGEQISAKDRQTKLLEMIETALLTATD